MIGRRLLSRVPQPALARSSRANVTTHAKIAMLVGFMACVLAFLARPAAALDQAMPQPRREIAKDHPPIGPDHADHPGHDDHAPPVGNLHAFAAQLDFTAFRRLAIQHDNQVKIIDSWARQTLYKITRRHRIEGQDPVFTVLDMAFRRDYWFTQPIVYIQAPPLREQLADFFSDPVERQRILTDGRVSPEFLNRSDVKKYLEQRRAADMRLSDAINMVYGGMLAFRDVEIAMQVIAPPRSDQPWHALWSDLLPNAPGIQMWAAKMGFEDLADSTPTPGYTDAQARPLLVSFATLCISWREGNAPAANAQLAKLSSLLPQVHPENYPPAHKRELELWYNRAFSGTLVGVLYFGAMVLFLLSASGVAPRTYRWAFSFYTIALILHAAAMGIRWYLAGRIPIQNQFESVMGSALLGCLFGAGLEAWRRNGLFGMAMAFVGFLATTACLVVPLVFGKSIGENVAPAAGILMTYWLYIHVNVVICSYALIAASFALGAKYLLAMLWYWINPLMEPAPALAGAIAGGGTAALSGIPPEEVERISRQRRNFLETLDGANVVMMRLAFLFLGAGIVLGAVWADVSWGRPWGWDPKETFALVTWLVYLVLIHIRFAAPSTKGAATAALSVLGFGIMMFNWIGVNFLLVGLHSYA